MKSGVGMVYIIDDDDLMQSSLARLMRTEGFHFASFSSAEEFLELKALKRPACVILDVQLPGLNGPDLQNVMEEKGIKIPIIFITGNGEIPMSVQAMKKGAIDFLPKPFKNEMLLNAVNLALEKDRAGVQNQKKCARIQRTVNSLSERERQVLLGVIAGQMNKQIARNMGITEITVKVHRARVMRKMKAGSLAQLINLAQAVGISAFRD